MGNYDIKDRLVAHGKRMEQVNPISIIYTVIRSNVEIGSTDPITASTGNYEGEGAGLGAPIVENRFFDYFLDRYNLIVDGIFYLPVVGDRISDGTYNYQVTAMSSDEPCYQFVVGSKKRRLRIHTVKID